MRLRRSIGWVHYAAVCAAVVVSSFMACHSTQVRAESEAPVLVVGGDVNLGRRQNAISSFEGPGSALGTLKILRSADLSFVNLESVIATVGFPAEKGEKGPYYFRGRPEILAVLGEAGIDVVGLANNHSFDYGPKALFQQLSFLDSMAIAHTGAGQNFETACAPVFRKAGDFTIAFFSLDSTMSYFAAGSNKPGSCHLDKDDPKKWFKHLWERIKEARKRAHLVMVAVHWGKNLKERPTTEMRELAYSIVNAGADAILGSSAHIFHGMEIYQGRPIIYDAGNLLFDLKNTPGTDRSILLKLHMMAEGVKEVEIWPLRVGYGKTKLDKGESASATIEKFANLSRELGTEVSIVHEKATVKLPVHSVRRPPLRPLMSNPPMGLSPNALKAPPLSCIVRQVPKDARMEPLNVGPMKLVGLRIDPPILHGRKMLWVESFWMVDETPLDNLFIDPRMRHRNGTKSWSSRHEPCDWQWPTKRWKPKVIVHDGGRA